MHTAAQYLLGEHDFSAFRSSRCQASHAVRVMQKISVIRQGDFLILDIKANAFLHHMVRNIAGVLMAIGAGDKPVAWSAEVLEHRDRTLGGVTASPDGLYFIKVSYPEHFRVPVTDVKNLFP